MFKYYSSAGPRRLAVPSRTAAALIAFALALPAIGAAAPNAPASRAADTGHAPSVGERAAYEFHVLAGEMALQRGNRRLAAEQYAAALRYSDDPKLARRAGQIAVVADQPRLAYQAVQSWLRAEPNSPKAQRAAARLAFLNGDGPALTRYAGALVDGAASPRSAYAELAKILDDRPANAAIAIATLRSLAEQHPRSAPAQYALGALALDYDRPEIAADAARRAHRLAPEWSKATLLQAGVWIHRGETDRARRLVDAVKGPAEQRAQYHVSLAHILLGSEQQAAARDEFARALSLAPADDEARYGLAVLALGTGDLDRAERAFKALYDHDAHVDAAAYYLGTIYDRRAAYARAERWYARVDQGHSKQAFAAGIRRVQAIAAQGDLERARAQLDQLRPRHPDQAERIAAFEGQLLYQQQRDAEALEVYNRALTHSPHSTDLLYGRSIVYERLGRIKNAKADLREVLAADADDVRALNALGYMLTNHGDRYTQALGYIHKALSADPSNPAIQDSMGWVQYRLGHLKTARRYLEKAYKAEPGPEIAAHLGAVRWKQGDHASAQRVWQQARADAPDNAVLRDIMQQFGQ